MRLFTLIAALVLGIGPNDPTPPRPVLAWAAGPLDVKVAFERPIEPAVARDLVGKTIAFGPKEANGTSDAPLGSLRIAAATLADEGRTLVLATDPHPREATYRLTLTRPGTTLDVSYDLHGVEVAWDDGQEGAKPAWAGWWPHIDPEITHSRTVGSVEHERQLASLGKPGRLVLRTLIVPPKGPATVRLASNRPFEATLGFEAVEKSADDGKGTHRAAPSLESTGDAVELAVTVQTDSSTGPLTLHVALQGGGDPAERPLTLDQQTLPWVPPVPPSPAVAAAAPELAGGDRRRGEAIFTSEEAKCSTCHKVRGQGGDVGPDLTDVHLRRDAAAIYRDIAEPSAQIDPNYVPYTVALQGGQVAAGIVRAEGSDSIKVLDTEGKATIIRRSEIEELRPGSTSIMPVGLAGALGEAKMRDLLAYLLSPTPDPTKGGSK